ncbi:MAG: hypothetical protein Q9217_005809 [Psora testacea]
MSARQGSRATLKSRKAKNIRWRCRRSVVPRRVPPSPAVTDTFTILAQENLNRLVGQRESVLTRKPWFHLRHPRELGTCLREDEAVQSTKPRTEAELLNDKYAQLGSRRQLWRASRDDGPTITLFTSNHKHGVNAGGQVTSKVEGSTKGLVRRVAVPHQGRTHSSPYPITEAFEGSNQPLQQSSALESNITAKEDETIHKDLETILDTLRNSQATDSNIKSPSADPNPCDDPTSGLRTSHLSRLASRYYRHASKFRGASLARSYSTGTGVPGNRRLASTVSAESHVATTSTDNIRKVSAVSDIAPDRPFIRGNATLQPGIGGEHIRHHLQLWQAYQDTENPPAHNGNMMPSNYSTNSQNSLTQSGEDDLHTIVPWEDDIGDDNSPRVDEEEGTLSVIQAPMWLKQGDLVEHWASGEPILTIFIKNVETGNALYYTERGSWLFRKSQHSLFSLSSFADPKDLGDILPFAPSEEPMEINVDKLQPMSMHAPRGIGVKTLGMMRRFHKASDELYRKYADRLNRGYEILAPESQLAGRKIISLQDATMRILQKRSISDLTPTMLWTTHRTLCKMQNIVTDWRTHRINPEFEFFPKQDLEDINRVKDYIREFQEIAIEQRSVSHDRSLPSGKADIRSNPIASFVEKARTAIFASRRTRLVSPTGYVGPSSTRVEPSESNKAIWKVTPIDTLSVTDKMIVQYMDAWVASRYLNTSTNYSALGPMILRAVGLYENHDLDQSTGFTFLQELGVISPWQNRSVYLTYSGLPGHSPSHPITVSRTKAQQQLNDIRMTDNMVGFRKDWGDLPVYCIDDAETMERDDGVSLENIDGENCIHIHVANPSAFIAPDSAFACYAAKLSESVYLPELKYPMLEPKLSKEYFSLGPDRPCITFSAKVDSEGEVADYAISHGFVHNVHYITPQALERELGLSDGVEKQSTILLNVGGIMPDLAEDAKKHSPCSDRPLTSADIETLHKLRAIGKATQRRREQNGALTFERRATVEDTISPRVFFGRGVSDTSMPLSSMIQRFDGDPVISLVLKTEGVRSVFAMVAQLMILAGEICANWCRERHLPIPYRGVQINPQPSFSRLDFKRNVIDPQLEKQGFVNEVDLVKYLKELGSSDCSASPLEHIPLGLPAYAKATSPLRRYCDILAHWQIEAAIRHDKGTKTHPKTNTDVSCLPFSQEQVGTACKKIIAREGQISNVRHRAVAHWCNQALFRAFYFKEAPLPETFTVKVLFKGNGITLSTGYLLGWANVVQLEDQSPSAICQGGHQVGDIWEARIRKIVLYTSSVLMEPLTLRSRNTKALNSEI